MKMRLPRLPLVAALMVISCLGMAPPAGHAARPSYNLMMNWFPEPEEGGFYEAQRLNLYQKAGLTSSVELFGFIVTTEQYVLSGRAAFGMGSADELLQYNARGAHLVAVMATFQKNPIGILWHAEDKTVRGPADLSHHTLIYSFGVPYEKYLVARYHYTDFSTKNNDFSSRAFAADPLAVHQCYVTSEPYLYTKQGLKVKYAFIADTGYNPYGNVIYTTQQFAAAHPEVVRAFVTASVKGWHAYLQHPEATNTFMRSAPGARNYPETPEEQRFSFSQMSRFHLVDGGDAARHGLGSFTLDRWRTLQRQMDGSGFSVGKVNPAESFTNRFLPGSR